jgi:hypothetical protein
MREPKFSDAWCFGKEFQAKSKICRICLANQQCQKKFFKTLGVTTAQPRLLVSTTASRVRNPQHPAESISS